MIKKKSQEEETSSPESGNNPHSGRKEPGRRRDFSPAGTFQRSPGL